MLLIYTPCVTNRLEYIFNLYFRELLGENFRFTTLKEEFMGWPDEKINYSPSDLGSGLYIKSAGLLSEKSITPQDTETFEVNGSTVFFKNDDRSSVFPFDL